MAVTEKLVEPKPYTVFVCDGCQKSHSNRESAEVCCDCDECGTPTNAVDRERDKFRRQRGEGLRCSWCFLRQEIKANEKELERATNTLNGWTAQVERAKQSVEKATATLTDHRDQLAALGRKPRKAKS